jgi:hypothetical protein
MAKMPALVARKLAASPSLQSSAKATRTRSLLSQPISKPSEHQRRLLRDTIEIAPEFDPIRSPA